MPNEGRVVIKARLARHRNFYLSAALGLVAGGVALLVNSMLVLAIGVNVFFLGYLALTLGTAHKLTAEFLRRHADEEDEPAPLILVVMLAAVVASAASLFLVLMDSGSRAGLQLVLGIASVVLGWFAIHTMWAMHYAYEYYQASNRADRAPKGKAKPGGGGLEFPGDEAPNGVSFLYFAYVIGMTAQTSDTGVATTAMRRLVLVHGVFSFFFNTVLVAAAVNVVVSLAH